jgi:hypothetical protein
MKTMIVSPDPNRRWRLEYQGARRASGLCPTQTEAIERARRNLTRADGGLIHVFSRSGSMRTLRVRVR